MRAVALMLILVALLAAPVRGAPGDCIPQCDIPSTEAAFVPPVTIVASGSTLSWSGVPVENTAHTATESGVSLSSPCFNVQFVPNPGNATFTIHDGGLWASQPLKAEKPCTTATALPDGSFAVRYHCLYHAQMVGVIVVRSASG